MAPKRKDNAKISEESLVAVERITRSGRKINPVSVPVVVDEDFVDPPGCYNIQNQLVGDCGDDNPVSLSDAQNDGGGSSEDDEVVDVEGYPTVGIRACPKLLVAAIKEMNKVQKNAVRNIGFGHILDMKVKKIPAAMGRWLLENFDARSCELKLSRGRPLHLEAIDAALMFGLPNGKQCVERKQKQKYCPLLLEWKAMFPNDLILPKHVKDKMLDQVDGGIWFKRHFMVLLQVCLFENPGNGYVNPQIMSNLVDVSTLRSLDWGEYMLRCLVDSKVAWGKKKSNLFVGPMLFLLGTYLDRVVLFRRTVPRSFPLINAWTYNSMKQRQTAEIKSGGFGTGHLFTRYEYTMDSPDDVNTTSVIGYNGEPSATVATEAENSAPVDDIRGFADSFLSKAKLMANTMVELMAMVQGAPREFMCDPNVKQMVDKAQVLLGCKATVTTENGGRDELHPGCTQQLEDAFWGQDDISDQLQKLEEAAIKRFEFKKSVDAKNDAINMPSFSLGLTQEFGIDHIESNKGTGGPFINNSDLVVDAGQTEQGVAGNVQETNGVIVQGGNAPKGKRHDYIVERPARKKQRKNVPTVIDKLKGPAQCDKAIPTVIENLQGQCQNEQVGVAAGRHMMTRRTHTELKRSDKLSSPYVPRALAIGDKLSEIEKKIGFWIMHNREPNMDEILFFTGAYELQREQMMSLLPTEFVVHSIIDVWSLILNHKEKSRSPGSPLRFFASTYLTAFSVVAPAEGWDLRKRSELFFRQLSDEINNCTGMQFVDIDMFVFPIVHLDHYYMLSFDLRNVKVELIDNSSAMDMSSLEEKYGDIPLTLDKIFTLYLEARGRIKAAMCLRSAEVIRLAMAWRDDTNKEDCGVFLMRHMETYQGGGAKNWKSGLQKNNKKQLNLMRVKYYVAIVSSDINVFKDQVVKVALKHYHITREEGSLNLAPILLNPKAKLV